MKNTSGNKRIVSLCFHDFQVDTQTLRDLVGCEQIDFAKTGDRTGRTGVIRKNFFAVWESTNALESWDDATRRLLMKVGGMERIAYIRSATGAKQAWLQINLPAMGSPYVETNRISTLLLREIGLASFGLEFEMFAFDHKEPTHHPADWKGGKKKRPKRRS